MEVKTEISNIFELQDMAWSGGLETIKGILELDRRNNCNTNYAERLFSHIEEMFMFDEETPSITSINDYLWFETSDIYEAIGLNEDGEIPTSVDEARAEGTTWGVDSEAIEKMEETGLFEKDFIEYLKEQLEDHYTDVYHFDFEELYVNQEQEVTEEQVDYLNDNC
jgi:hypothetical protein